MVRIQIPRLTIAFCLIGTALGLSLSSADAANTTPQLIHVTENVSARLVDVDMSNDGLIAYTVAYPIVASNPAYTAKVIRTTNGGLDWAALSNSPVGAWKAVSTSSDGQVVAVVGDVAAGEHRLFVSTDRGDTWTQSGPTEADYIDVAVSGDGDTIVVSRSIPGDDFPTPEVSYSHDGGTWATAVVSDSTLEGIGDLDVAVNHDGSVMVASAFGGSVWRSVDSGVTWVDLYATEPVTRLWQDVAISDDGLTVFGVVFGGTGHVWNGNVTPPVWIEAEPLGFTSGQAVRAAISPNGRSFMATSYLADPRIVRNWNPATNTLGSWSTESMGRQVLGLAVSDNGDRLIAVNEQNGIWVRIPETPLPVIVAITGPCGGLEGPTTGGATLEFDGRYLFDPTVTVGGRPATVQTGGSPTRLRVITPAGVAGPADVVVSTLGGSITFEDLFTYDSSPQFNWSRIGDAILGKSENELSGYSLATSADGLTIAIGGPGYDDYRGVVRVYRWNGRQWSSRGSAISPVDGVVFGYVVSLSADGDTLAVGSPWHDDGRGRVHVYTWSGGDWIERGAPLVGTGVVVDDGGFGSDVEGDVLGHGVALSADGETLVIGAPGRYEARGVVTVHDWNGTAWVPRGDEITGTDVGDQSGEAVAISNDGDIVAIGASSVDDSRGRVRVYAWDDTAWSQRGVDLVGEEETESFGWAIALGNNGDTLAVGARWHDDGRGTVRVFDWESNAWSQHGTDLDGSISSSAGESVALSADASVVAFGKATGCLIEEVAAISVWDRNEDGWSNRGEFNVVDPDPDSWSYLQVAVAMSSTGNVIVGSHIGIDDQRGVVSAWGPTPPTQYLIAPPPDTTPPTKPPVGPPSPAARDELPAVDGSTVLSGVTTGEGGRTILVEGSQVEMTLDGFEPNEDAWLGLFSDPVTIATVTADANGVVSTNFIVPFGQIGDHMLTIYGAESEAGARIPVRIVAATLPVTGSDIGPRQVWPLALLFFSLGLTFSLVFWVKNSLESGVFHTQNGGGTARSGVRRRGGRPGTGRTRRPRRP